MKHEVIRTVSEWRRLREEWQPLLENSGSNTLFMTWDWLDAWLTVADRTPDLFVICVRETNGNLVGIAAYYHTRYKLLGTFPYRVLRMVGDTNSGAEYQTWVANKNTEKAVFAHIVAALRATQREWDLIWMPQLDAWSGLNSAVVDALKAGRLMVNSRPRIFSAFDLPAEFDSYLQRMSPRRRQQVRRISRKLLGDPNVEVRRIESAEALSQALDALFDLHGKRWRAAGELGVFVRRPAEKLFYEQFAPRALERGWLAMYLLVDRGQPKAVQIGYVYDGAFLQLQEGFDPDYSAHAGNVLRAAVIEDCINQGAREYDFLGGITEHKRRWLAQERQGMDLLAASPRLKNVLLMQAGVWPTGKYLVPVEHDA